VDVAIDAGLEVGVHSVSVADNVYGTLEEVFEFEFEAGTFEEVRFHFYDDVEVAAFGSFVTGDGAEDAEASDAVLGLEFGGDLAQCCEDAIAVGDGWGNGG